MPHGAGAPSLAQLGSALGAACAASGLMYYIVSVRKTFGALTPRDGLGYAATLRATPCSCPDLRAPPPPLPPCRPGAKSRALPTGSGHRRAALPPPSFSHSPPLVRARAGGSIPSTVSNPAWVAATAERMKARLRGAGAAARPGRCGQPRRASPSLTRRARRRLVASLAQAQPREGAPEAPLAANPFRHPAKA